MKPYIPAAILRKIAFLFLLIHTGSIYAQTPEYRKCCNTITSSIPFGAVLNLPVKEQLWYDPSDLTPLPPEGYINKLYFKTLAFQTPSAYINFKIKLKQPSDNKFLSLQRFDTDSFTLVLDSSYINISKASGWAEITLATPFYYNNTRPLLVEISHGGRVSPGFEIFGSGSSPKKISVTGFTTHIEASGQSWDDFGFSLLPKKPNDAGIVMESIDNSSCSGLTQVGVRVRNEGNTAISNLILNWELDGITQSLPLNVFLDSAGSAFHQDDTLIQLQVPVSGRSAKTLTLWTHLPNGVSDQRLSNDTIKIDLKAPLSGLYSVGQFASDYTALTDLVTDLRKYGVCGPVTVSVAPQDGPYEAGLDFRHIQGLSAVNTLTLNGNGAMLKGTSETLLSFFDVSYITIDSFIITGTSNYTGTPVFIDYAQHIIIRNSLIYAGFTTQNAAINIGFGYDRTLSANTGYLRIHNNRIVGGYWSIRSWYARNYGTTISNNIFQDFYDSGIEISGGDSVYIVKNTFFRPERTTAESLLYGIFASGQGYRIHSNIITNLRGSNVRAISVSNTSTVSGKQFEIINNVIYSNSNTGVFMGIALSGQTANDIQIYHNTIHHSVNSTSSVLRGLNIEPISSNIDFRNNIISITGNGTGVKTGIYSSDAASVFKSNHNVIHLAGTGTKNIGFLATARQNLADWQSATGQDQFSITTDPLLSTSTGIPLSPNVDNLGIPLGIVKDNNSMNRSVLSPDAGAYEFSTAPSCTGTPDAGQIISNVSYACSAESFGLSMSSYLPHQNYHYQWQRSSAGSMGPFIDLPGETFKTLTASQGATHWYRIVVSCGVQADTTEAIRIKTTGSPLSGSYTVNPSLPLSVTNFHSLSDLSKELGCAGISSPVIIDIAPQSGPYPSGVSFSSVPGTSHQNTITIKGNGNVISGNTSPLLSFSKSAHFILDSLNLTATGTYTGMGIFITNQSHHLTIQKSTIDIGLATSGQAYSAIVASGSATKADQPGNNATYLTIQNNEITGGVYGIAISGEAGYRNSYGHIIRNNNIRDFISYGVNLNHTDTSFVLGNDIQRPVRTNSVVVSAGVTANSSRNIKISQNRIHHLNGVFVSGISLISCNSEQGYETEVFNNLVYANGNSGQFQGIWIYGAPIKGIKIMHNTIQHQIPNTAQPIRGVWVRDPIESSIFKNNIISLTGLGTGIKTGIYLGSSSPTFSSGHNIIYISATGISNIGYWDDAKASLSDWIAASGQDGSSQVTDPQFTDVASGNLVPQSMNIDNSGSPLNINTDFNDLPRIPNTPDPGAFEISTAPACSQAFDAGRAVSSQNSPCPNTPFALSITGALSFTGYTYQWQSSLSGSPGTFTNMSSDTLRNLTQVQDTTKWYRAIVNCNSFYDTTEIVLVKTSQTSFSGNYTINNTIPASTTNFRSFKEAAAALRCQGVSGPVVFDVESGTGPYDGVIELGDIPGVSSSNTIRINGNGATIASGSTPIISFSNASYITLDSLKIKGSIGYTGFGIHIGNLSHHITIENCEIDVDTIANQSICAGIVVSGLKTYSEQKGVNAEYLTIKNNVINGGYYGITMTGNTGYSGNYGHLITDNHIKNFYSHGLNINNADSVIITNNTFHQEGRKVETYRSSGIFADSSRNLKITRNRIHTLRDEYVFSIAIANSVNLPGKETDVSNNLIYNCTAYDNFTAISFHNTLGLMSHHNSIHYYTSSTSASLSCKGFSISGNNNIHIKNNIISLSGAIGGPVYYLQTDAISPTLFSDYNILHVSSISNIAYNIESWRSLTGQDKSSLVENPLLTAPQTGNLLPTAQIIDNKGTPLGITTDFYGNPRNPVTPDAGAIEFTLPPLPPNCPATLLTGNFTPLISSSYLCKNTSLMFGLGSQLNSYAVKYQWQYSDDGIIYNNMIKDTFRQIVINQDTTHYYRVIVTCANSKDTSDIVFLKTSTVPLSGLYTLNPALPISPTNFHNLKDLASELKCNGVSGPVTITAAPLSGNYNGFVEFDSIPGASAINTITIKGNGNTIISTQCPVISFKNASYITLDSFVINSPNAHPYHGIFVGNRSHHLTFVKNTISVSGNYGAGIIASGNMQSVSPEAGNNGHFLTITQNTFSGGSFGVAIHGSSDTSDSYGHVISKNIIRDFYSTGISIQKAQNVNVSDNELSRPNQLSFASTYGISLSGYNFKVNENRIFNLRGVVVTGIYLFNANQTTVVNNLIYNLNNSGTFTGIITYGASSKLTIYHNTIQHATSGGTSAIRGIQFDGTPSEVDFRNNIISFSGTGTGVKTGIYVANIATLFNSNNNIIHLTGAGTNNTGFWTVARSTLLAWQTATRQDTLSLNSDPQFNSISTGDLTPLSAAVDNRGAAYTGVISDIFKQNRNYGSPDIGAIEFNSAPACSGTFNAGSAICQSNFVCPSAPSILSLNGDLTARNYTFKWQSSLSGQPGTFNDMPADTFRSILITQDTLTWYRAIVACGSSIDTTDAIPVVSSKLPLNGIYTINPLLPLSTNNFHSVKDALKQLECVGVSGPVTLNVHPGTGPYEGDIIFRSITGSSEANIIRINGNGSLISGGFSPIISFQNASYITLDSFNIIGTVGFKGSVIDIAGESHHISLLKNVISAGESDISNLGACIIADNSHHIEIAGNNLAGGYYGIRVLNSLRTGLANFSIKRNLISEFYMFGVEINHLDTVIVSQNILTRPVRVNLSSSSTGISLFNNRNIQAYSNKITNVRGNGFVGINITESPNLPGNINHIYNNSIWNTGSNTLTGMIISGISTTHIYHNTIQHHANGSSTSTIRGIYLNSSVSYSILRNNIISLTGTNASATKTGIYCSPANQVFSSDHNTIHISGSGNNYTGYLVSGSNSLADWRSASFQDYYSLNHDPLFTSLTNGDLTPLSPDIDNTGAPVNISTDINENIRELADPGAYNFNTAPTCSGTPNAGAASASISFSCKNKPVDLFLNNSLLSKSYRFQWQSSQSATGIYTDLLNDTFRKITIVPDTMRWYRAIVTCGGLSDTSTTVVIKTRRLPMEGPYTINSSAPASLNNFQSIQEAISELACAGVSGPVTISLSPGSGPYTGGIVIDSIPGSSSVNTITFKGNGVSITGTATPLIHFVKASYIIIDSLVIGTPSYAKNAVLLNAQSHHISILKNKIYGGTSGSNNECIRINGPYNKIYNNEITGGEFGVYIDSKSNSVLDNTVTDFRSTGIFITQSDSVTVSGNNISRPNRTGELSRGIYATACRNLLISENRIHTMAGSGIYIYGWNNTSLHSINIRNNAIYNFMPTSSFLGIFATDLYGSLASQVNVYHNTIQHNTTTTTNEASAIYINTGVSTTSLRNNLISFTGASNGIKYGLRIGYNSLFTSNYNNVHLATSGNNFVGFWGANWGTMADWQSASGQDLLSTTFDPNFTSLAGSNLIPQSASLDNKGSSVGTIRDLNGNFRSTTVPDIGAYEFNTSINCTGTPEAGNTVSTLNYSCFEDYTLSLTGSLSENGYRYQWQSSATGLAGSYIKHPGDTFTKMICNPGITKWYRAIVSCGNNADTTEATMVKTTPMPLSGIYTVNKNIPISETNFHDLKDLVKELKCAGISGPITFEFSPLSGPYEGGFSIDSIPGISPTNTVTFKGNGTLITGGSTPLISFSNASYIILDSFRINVSNNTIGIYIGNSSHHLTISNNVINADISSTSTSNAGIVISGLKTNPIQTGNNAWNIIIRNNEIIGGYYGIALTGLTGHRGNYSNTLLNNIIRDFYGYAVYANHGDSLRIEGNDIYRPARSTFQTNSYGIYLTNSRGTQVKRNLLHHIGGNDVHAISIHNSNNALGNETTIENNLIYNINNSGLFNGIYGVKSPLIRINIHHNTIQHTSANAVSKAVFFDTVATFVSIRNNIIALSSSGTGLNTALYFTLVSPTLQSNHNVIYTSGANCNAGYYGIGKVQLNDWKAFSGLDGGSTSANPNFASVQYGNLTPLNVAVDNIGTALGTMTDIRGISRALIYPDAGAYEFTGITRDISVTDAYLKRSGLCLSQNDSAIITLHNNLGPAIDLSADPLTIYWNVDGPLGISGSATINSGNIPPGGNLIFRTNAINMSSPGDYRLRAYLTPGVNNLNSYNDSLSSSAISILPLLYAIPRLTNINNSSDTVILRAFSELFTNDTGISGFTWSYMNSPFSNNREVTVGPFTSPGSYEYIASYTNVCGTFFDTVHVIAGAGVPVKLISFTGQKVNRDAKLVWSTASESNNAEFIIQKSYDNTHFENIGSIKGSGSTVKLSRYSYTDHDAFNGRNIHLYYRLIQMDDNGAKTVSKSVRVSDESTIGKTEFIIIPNPFDNFPTLQISSEEDQTPVDLSVSDVNGRILFSRKVLLQKGTNMISLDEMDEKTPGIYFIKVTDRYNYEVKRMIKF